MGLRGAKKRAHSAIHGAGPDSITSSNTLNVNGTCGAAKSKRTKRSSARVRADDDANETGSESDAEIVKARPHFARPAQPPPPRQPFLVLHLVNCDGRSNSGDDHSSHPRNVYYLDPPRLFARDNRSSFLRGLYPSAYTPDYLNEHEEVYFVVIREYKCQTYHAQHEACFESTAPLDIEASTYVQYQSWFHILPEDLEPARPRVEFVTMSQQLEEALVQATDFGAEGVPLWTHGAETRAPYDFFYHHRRILRATLPELSERHQARLSLLLDYIDQSQSKAFADADATFQAGFVSEATFSKLITQLELVVTKSDSGNLQAYVVDHVESLDTGPRYSMNLSCWSWKFDGGFTKSKKDIKVELPARRGPLVAIRELRAWPLRLEPSEVHQYLRDRGATVWRCRKKKLVSYEATQNASFDLQITDPRFMIDFDMYRYLHKAGQNAAPSLDGSDDDADGGDDEERDEMKEIIDMNSDEPPGGNFLLLLPATIRGFGFHDKRWRSLQIDQIRDVPWNKDAFGQLVLKPSKKTLIEALVTFHLEKNDRSDIINNKGNGLILLLHGPPGTGKTLTAETVAERAEMPLYRVTCGDMGTNAESVEKYLESALYVGSIWNCVVLLDEADVFLEERTQNDLNRNALVSVFLRVLEYYQGILILTSNRVGTFDEAFKSRVQLAVKYPSLDWEGRFQIWSNLLTALEENKADIEFAEIRKKIHTLARHELNGRQIRNMIKTARQLALFQRQRMKSQHLDAVIEVANEFEEYLLETRGHDDDEWATAQKWRGPEAKGRK